MGLEEKIAEIEKEISRTQKNKATEKHLGLLKSRLIKYKLEFEAAGGKLQEKKATAGGLKTGGKAAGGKKGTAALPTSKPKPERVHRKQNENSSSSDEDGGSEEDSSDDSEEDIPVRQRINPFALLEDDAGGKNAGKSDEDDSGEEADESADTGPSSLPEALSRAAKAQKKKKKKASKAAGTAGGSHGQPAKPLQSMTEEELIEMFAAQNLLSAGEAALDRATSGRHGWAASSACINAKLLNYRYEFQKTVGKSGMSAMLSGDTAASSSATKATRGLVKGVQSLFVNQPPNTYDPKMVMDQFVEMVKDPRRPNFLVFKRLKKYKEIQRNFLMMVYSNQDQIVQDILHEMPFHTDALLLMCSIYERDDNISSARQAIETALLGLQSCFDFQQRNNPHLHRMSYRYPANRSYFVTLFKHIVLTAPRFPATALEMGKYLFNLDLKEDPLAVILMLDYLALRAKDYSYLIAFCQAFQDRKHLDMLPSFTYSMPLALYIRGTAHSDEEDIRAAGTLLQDALMKFPGLFRLLSEKLDLPRDHLHTPAAFSRLFSLDDNDGLTLLQALYVRRCTDFWKDQGVMAWLMDNVNAVIQRAHENRVLLATYGESRKRLYRGTPSNIWRHVLLLNIPYSEHVFQMRLPADAQSFVFPFDPIPPVNSEEKDEWDLRVHLSPPDRRSNGAATAHPLGAVLPPVANGPADTVMQLVFNATGEFLRQLLPSTAVAAAAEPDPASLVGGEVVMGAAIADDDEESGELRECMDAVETYLHARESTAAEP
ncbi:putative Transcription factor 25 [Hypsibius exemplaris]|uniref:Transcription factor 25 n=1 Tax=Hypsibius exemplaris TaxID=2072580 RepID=A0A1W0X7W4_HYPEX|nr:putative Transcription factor 25 [Hypsibius exemplaris]